MSSFEPFPTRTSRGSTPSFAASAALRWKAEPSGYRCTSAAASRAAASARGDGPSAFSFEASFATPVTPYSRSSSSMGLPGT